MDDSDDSTEREGSPSAEPPDVTELESPAEVLNDHPVRARLFDVVLQLREPTQVAVIADRANCDTETARDYLDWFEFLGIVTGSREHATQYERNDAYFQWRRVEQLRSTHSNEEIREQLTDVREQLVEYRNRFDVERPADVSPEELDRDLSTEAVWEVLAEWKTLQQRAELLAAAYADDDMGSS
jgi:hypothetical protein